MRKLLIISSVCCLGPQAALVSSGLVSLPATTASGWKPPVLPAENDTQLSVTFVDDVPMSAVELPFVFPFFGSALSTVYVSPNGYIQMSPVPQCGNYFASWECDPITNFTGLIGPLVSDFDPPLNPDARVWLHVNDTNTSACVQWENVPLWRSSNVLLPNDTLWTFQVCLFDDGSIRWSFSNFSTAPVMPGYWMVRDALVLRSVVFIVDCDTNVCCCV